MKRRHFLIQTAAFAAAGSLPLLGMAKTVAIGAAPRFTLAQLDLASEAFDVARACRASACTADSLMLHLDAFVPAPTPVLQALRVQALFDVKGSAQTPYFAWDYAAGSAGNSRGVSFVVGRECMRQFALDYHIRGDRRTSRALVPLTSADVPLLHPGHYVLAGPRADGGAADLDGLRYSGDPQRPLPDRARAGFDFDYLAFRIASIA